MKFQLTTGGNELNWFRFMPKLTKESIWLLYNQRVRFEIAFCFSGSSFPTPHGFLLPNRHQFGCVFQKTRCRGGWMAWSERIHHFRSVVDEVFRNDRFQRNNNGLLELCCHFKKKQWWLVFVNMRRTKVSIFWSVLLSLVCHLKSIYNLVSLEMTKTTVIRCYNVASLFCFHVTTNYKWTLVI